MAFINWVKKIRIYCLESLKFLGALQDAHEGLTTHNLKIPNIYMIQRNVGTIATFASKKELQKAMSDIAVSFVVTTKREHSSVVAASQPWKWFRLHGFVNDSRASKALCRIGAGNAELGNRGQTGRVSRGPCLPMCGGTA